MSILSRTKPEKQEKKSVEGAPVAEAQPRKVKGPAAVLSASPRANLMPPEIGQNNSRKAVRRGLRLLVVAVALVVAAGIGAAWAYSVFSASALADAQAESQRLIAEQAEYAEVQAALDGIAEGTAAAEVGGSTDIDWADYLDKLQAGLPDGVTISDVNVDSADVQTPYVQSTVPLEGPRIATITFTASSPTLPSFPDWIDGLSSLPGFADASPQSVTLADGVYAASMTLHVNTNAYSHQYDAETEEAGE